MENKVTDGEINLIPYLLAVLRRWHWIVLAALLGGLVAGAFSLSRPRLYEAKAAVIYVGERTRLNLDPRVTTLDNPLSNFYSRRQALLELATSGIMESQLPPETIRELAPTPYKPGDLAGAISTEEAGDLLWISAVAATPEKAQQLATVWAEHYVAYINQLFGPSSESVAVTQQQVADAEAAYEQAQQSYADYIGTNQLYQLNQEIDALVSLLEGSQRANANLYTYQLTRAQALSLLLEDARVLRDQIGEDDTLSAGERLALLLLRVRTVDVFTGQSTRIQEGTVATTSASAVPLQVQISAPTEGPEAQAQLSEELDRFITTLEQQLSTLQAELQQTRDALVNNEPARQSAVSNTERQQLYQRLRDLLQQRAVIEGRQEALLQARDIALEKLQVMQRKLAEQQVASDQDSPEVRFASAAPLPTAPMRRGTLIRMIIGGTAGAVFGVFLAVLSSLPLPTLLGRRMTAKQPADHRSYS